MRISKTAEMNHEELFPNHKSTLKVTDPELIEVFDNFAFDEVLSYGKLDIKTRELLTFSMILSLGGCEPQLKGHIQGNVNVGNDKKTLLSVVTQLLPYVGYPRTLNAIRCLNDVLPE